MNADRFFRIEQEGDVLLVGLQRPVGSLADAQIHDEVEILLQKVDAAQPAAVVVDFRHVSYFGSMMLEALRVLWNRLEAHGAKLVLCNVSDVGREILELAKFDTLWPIYPSRAAALAAVRK
ncbi:MAG: STAS domain-containing protein [Planctomycetales bacterium]